MSDLPKFNLGIDWGTTFTKVCVRDETETSQAVTFGGKTLAGSLLLSRIGIFSNGRLLAGLTAEEWEKPQSPNMIPINFIKMRLANVDLPRETYLFEFTQLPSHKSNDLNAKENLENLGAYYLSVVIRKAKEWFDEESLLEQWSANVGVPVEYQDSPANECFERVLRLAWLLTQEAQEGKINLEDLKFKELQEKCRALRNDLNDEIPCFAVPEVAAGTYFYIKSQKARAGDYLYVDIGGGTTEFCSFQFSLEQGEEKIDAIKAYAPPIGIDAIADGIASESGLQFEEVREELNDDKSTSLKEDIESLIRELNIKPERGEYIAAATTSEPTCCLSQEAIERKKSEYSSRQRMLLELMLWQRAIHLLASKRSAKTQEVLLGGGGRESKFYKNALKSTYTSFRQEKNSDRYSEFELDDVENSDQLNLSAQFNMNEIPQRNFHRFAIAFGLSIPSYKMPDFQLPSFWKPRPSSLNQGGVKKILDHLNPSTADWRDK